MSRWQLSNKATPVTEACGRGTAGPDLVAVRWRADIRDCNRHVRLWPRTALRHLKLPHCKRPLHPWCLPPWSEIEGGDTSGNRDGSAHTTDAMHSFHSSLRISPVSRHRL